RQNSRGQARSIHLGRLANSGELITVLLITAKAIETVRITNVVLNVLRRDSRFAIAPNIGALQYVPQRDEAFGVLEWQRPQHYAFNDRENRGCSADAERQRQHGGKAEGRRLCEMTNCEPQILECHSTLLTTEFLSDTAHSGPVPTKPNLRHSRGLAALVRKITGGARPHLKTTVRHWTLTLEPLLRL